MSKTRLLQSNPLCTGDCDWCPRRNTQLVEIVNFGADRPTTEYVCEDCGHRYAAMTPSNPPVTPKAAEPDEVLQRILRAWRVATTGTDGSDDPTILYH